MDALRLSQIVNNLLSNAIKASEKSSVKIEVNALEEEKVQVSVLDNGIGLNSDEQSVIFNLIRRVCIGDHPKVITGIHVDRCDTAIGWFNNF